MTRFLIVRHGETAWNAEGRVQGHLDIALTEKGIEQAKLASRKLESEKIDVVYSSDLKRALVTGEIIAEPHGLHVRTTPLLREAMLGAWQGLTMKEAAERFPDDYAAYSKDSIGHRPPGAETLQEVIDRCRAFLDLAIMECPNCTVAVAAHGGAIRGILAAAFGLGPELYRRVRLDNGGLTVLEISEDKPLLVVLNDTCHMATPGVGDGADQ
jgi:alpha-ribazole phosphatase/probable phosphoglycerate mutase